MGNSRNTRRLWINAGIFIQKRLIKIRRGWPKFIGSFRPFLARRYWPAYLLFFAVGFYLFGPTKGMHKIQTSLTHRSSPSHTKESGQASLATLQKELAALKAKLRDESMEKPAFNPEEFSRPILGQVVQKYEWIQTDNSWRLHPGVDISVSGAGNVIAAAQGTVLDVKETGDGSFTVIVDHGGGWKSVYANLASTTVLEGQKVIKGLIIGTGGNFGCIPGQPGVHFGILHNDKPVNPQNVVKGL